MDLGKTVLDGLTGFVTGIAGGPIGMIAGLLGGIGGDVLPALLPHLAGPQGEDVAKAVVSVVAAATGIAQPTAASVLGLTPDARAALQVQLAQIAMQAESNKLADAAGQRASDLANLQASLIDTQSARAQTVDLVKAGSPIAYGAPIISVVVLVAFGVMAWLVMFRAIPPGSETLAAGVLEALKLLSVTVVAFWCGSSSGSRAKDATLASAQTALANSMPVPGAPVRPLAP
jgi:hypothetical protein